MGKIGFISSAVVIMAASVACGSDPGESIETRTLRMEGTLGSGALEEAASLGPSCAHPVCAAGVALTAGCDPCATRLCAQDAYCCTTEWDTTCVAEVGSICGLSCTAPPPPDAGASTCAHPICAAGGALVSGCDPCVTKLCAQDPYCCGTTWDATCVTEVASICGVSCQ